MGQRLTITEQEKNSIVLLYEQQVKPTSKFNSKDIEVFKQPNFIFKYDDLDDKIRSSYFTSDTSIFIMKSQERNKVIYLMKLRTSDIENIGSGEDVIILLDDNTRIIKKSVKTDDEGAWIQITPTEILTLTRKLIKKFRIYRTTDIIDNQIALNLRDGINTIYKISFSDINYIEKLLPTDYDTPKETTNKPTQTVEPTIGDDEDKIYTVAQIPAEFPGGFSGWQRYLERTLNKGILKQNNAPEGKYSIIVSFVVDRNGSISDIKAENDPGYGTKEEAIRVIEKGPKWKPAVQNGRNVNYRHRQSIVF
jgi:hypothetical protein